jgi:hypothetical protein
MERKAARDQLMGSSYAASNNFLDYLWVEKPDEATKFKKPFNYPDSADSLPIFLRWSEK